MLILLPCISTEISSFGLVPWLCPIVSLFSHIPRTATSIPLLSAAPIPRRSELISKDNKANLSVSEPELHVNMRHSGQLVKAQRSGQDPEVPSQEVIAAHSKSFGDISFKILQPLWTRRLSVYGHSDLDRMSRLSPSVTANTSRNLSFNCRVPLATKTITD